MDTQAAYGHTGSPWTHRLPMDTQAAHGHTGSPWTHRLPMDTQAAHGHTGCPWTHRLPMDTQAPHGHTGCPWTHRLPMDTGSLWTLPVQFLQETEEDKAGSQYTCPPKPIYNQTKTPTTTQAAQKAQCIMFTSEKRQIDTMKIPPFLYPPVPT